MTRSMRNPYRLLALIAMLVTACATTQLNALWKDPSYKARPYRVMVIGVAKNPVNRRIFEDEFVRQLNAHGTEAIASYTVLPDRQEDDHAVIAAKLAQLGADTVLITRMVSKKTVQFYVPGTAYYPPPYYGTWPDYYGYGYQALYTPGYMAEEEFAVIETNLYEARNDKLVWSASSETGLSGSDQSRIKSYIGIMVKTMAGQGLLGR
ncbi:MAG: hypothetical protein KGJ19_01930 [Betaproteobacteria bacterium]|nr:hypothetical protein [Betaproteobacteria bacterium]MDE2311255.1 hypothetical protein [Betaproteobacteria bacterium]